MLLPKDHPVYREDGVPFRAKMIAYIRDRYGDLLGEDAAELDHPEGLDRLAEKVRERVRQAASGATAPPRT